ncbi:DddA-like double-stranded DNA deaminase toxin [Duganella sp. Root336D2]|uniref:DddA-like double-stranded DNA deaminase toxin n=1 Tax=Duganella sp. Root336D2 TaxID=1736518 RepID=UPI002101B40E|nr:DddA-like double-stranded DNA deaminase toxin [Duganella sp. Root336D2]
MYGVLSGGRIVIARAVARSSVTRASITQESKTIGVTAEVAPNESLRNTSGDLRASANSARNQPYGNGQSASASPSTNSAGSSGKNVRLPRDYASELPEYDGKTTYGVLVTNEGKVIQLRSGGKEVPYSGYKAVSASHVEGKAAIWIRENASSGGTVYHNNTTGTCGYCNSQVKALLPEGVELKIVPPANAVARNSQAKAIPTINVGNATQPGRKP